MKTTRIRLIETGVVLSPADEKKVVDMINEYCLEVVDECAGSFECTMEENEEEDGEFVEAYTGISLKPILVRQSVLDVKNQIK